MAQLVGAIESEFVTDFSLLYAEQDNVAPGGAWTWTFAASAPGTLAMITGDKYSTVKIRVERWDSRPEWVGDDWEDCDELPWVSEPDGGRLAVRGFDPTTEEGLEVGDMGTSRVQVFARGRHQYTIDEPETPEPEHWLIRLWPEPGPTSPLAGPPRRTAGPRLWASQKSPWEAAVHGWEVSGWSRRLNNLNGFKVIQNEIQRVGHPFERDELLPDLAPLDWSSPVNRGFPMWSDSLIGSEQLEMLTNLVAVTGLDKVETYGDAFACLTRLGLLAECDTPSGKRWVPNPTPASVLPVLEFSDESIRCRDARRFPHIDVHYLEGDIEGLIRWSGSGLVTSPRKIAVRLSVPPEDVIDAVRLLAMSRSGAVDVDPHSIDADTTVTLKTAPLARRF